MAHVEELQIAPVKSLRPLRNVDFIEIGSDGLIRNDHTHMVVEKEPHTNVNYRPGETAIPGQAVTQREDRVLARITPEITDDGMVLRIDGKGPLFLERRRKAKEDLIPVKVWSWLGKAALVNDEADKWLTDVVGRPVRLVTLSEEEPRFVKNNPALGRVGFTDAHVITIASPEGFDAVNARLVKNGAREMPRDRFRSTMVVARLDAPPAEAARGAFPEDYVESFIYTVASSGLAVAINRYGVSARCPMPETNQMTGEFDEKRSVTKALVQIGRHGHKVKGDVVDPEAEVFFSQNCTIAVPNDMPEGSTIVIPRDAELDVRYSNYTNWAPSR